MKVYKTIMAALFLIILVGCEKEEFPTVTITTDKSSYAVDEEVTFTILGDAETFTIYTGDSLHYYDSSVIVLTEGQIIDQETLWLTQDSLDKVFSVVVAAVNKQNKRVADSLKVDTIQVKQQITDLVGKEYYSIQEAQYDLLTILSFLTSYTSTLESCILLYNKDFLYLAPQEGFSTGFVVDRERKTFTYSYYYPGTFKIVAIATNVSQKQYSGSGYQEEREQSASEYKFYREMDEIAITVN
ncbi:MAG: hypothetical protein WD577_05765 [Bacteroidales bacterium]